MAALAEAHDVAPIGHETQVPAADMYCDDAQEVAATHTWRDEKKKEGGRETT
jgi:hypothetical protein